MPGLGGWAVGWCAGWGGSFTAICIAFWAAFNSTSDVWSKFVVVVVLRVAAATLISADNGEVGQDRGQDLLPDPRW